MHHSSICFCGHMAMCLSSLWSYLCPNFPLLIGHQSYLGSFYFSTTATTLFPNKATFWASLGFKHILGGGYNSVHSKVVSSLGGVCITCSNTERHTQRRKGSCHLEKKLRPCKSRLWVIVKENNNNCLLGSCYMPCIVLGTLWQYLKSFQQPFMVVIIYILQMRNLRFQEVKDFAQSSNSSGVKRWQADGVLFSCISFETKVSRLRCCKTERVNS